MMDTLKANSSLPPSHSRQSRPAFPRNSSLGGHQHPSSAEEGGGEGGRAGEGDGAVGGAGGQLGSGYALSDDDVEFLRRLKIPVVDKAHFWETMHCDGECVVL